MSRVNCCQLQYSENYQILKKPNIFYGWYIVLVGIVIGALSTSTFGYGFSAFYIPWKEQFGWTRTQLSGVVGLSRLEGGIAAPIAGWAVDRFGPRKMMVTGLSIMGAGFLLLSQVTSLTQLYLVFLVFLAVGSSIGTYRPLQVAIANWFLRKRGRAMGFLMTGSGLGGSSVFLFAILIENIGWEQAAIVAALMIWGISVPLTYFVRHKPEQMGLGVDGDPIEDKPQSTGNSISSDTETPGNRRFWQRDNRPELDLTVWQALRTRAFWILAITYAIWAAMPGITTVHIAPFLAEELDLEYVTAVGALSFFVASSIIGRLAFGYIADYLDIRLLMSILFIFQGIGLFLFSEVYSLSVVPFYVVIFSIPYGGTIPMRSIIQGHFFGRRNFGTIGGLLQFVDLPATVAAPIWVGFLADSLPNGYRLGFKIIAATMVIAAVIILAARRPRDPLPKTTPPDWFLKFFSKPSTQK
jgi:sugar phosphate permease